MSGSALYETFARAPLVFERGEGVWLVEANGERYLDLAGGIAVNSLGHSHPHLVAALTEQAGKLWHVSNLYEIPGPAPACRAARREHLCRQGVLHQFGRRGAGMRDQDGAPLSLCERPSRALSHHHLRGRLPWPHAGDDRRRRPAEIPGRFRPQGRRLRPGAVRRHRRGRQGDHAGDRGDPGRAGAGRGRHPRSSRRSR